MIKKFIREEEGQNLVEYALLLPFIALLASTALPDLEEKLVNVFERQVRDFNHPSNPLRY